MTAILPYPVRGPLPPPLLILCSLSSSSSISISKNMPIFTATIGSISLPSHLLNPEAVSSLSSCRLSYSRPFNFSFRPSQLLAAARPSFRVSASADESQKTANSTAVLEDSSGSEETIDPLLQARMSADWKAAKGHFETGLIYEGRIESYNKGGFLVRFYSLVGFLPFRQLSPSHAWKEPRRTIQQIAPALAGSIISTKVIEVDEESRKLILSEKDAIWAKYSEKINVGDICAGIVGSVEDYGAFIHLCFPDGLYHVTGMVHASEVSWDLVQDVRDVLTVGDEVRVKVVSIDRNKSRINLSIKQLEGDPFLQTLEKAIPQDNSTGSDALGTSSAIEPLPGLEAIFDELLKEDGVEDVRINRQGFERRVVSQDLQLWLSNAPPVERKFTLLARAGRQVQEIQLTTSLDQEGIKKALQRALERVP